MSSLMPSAFRTVDLSLAGMLRYIESFIRSFNPFSLGPAAPKDYILVALHKTNKKQYVKYLLPIQSTQRRGWMVVCGFTQTTCHSLWQLDSFYFISKYKTPPLYYLRQEPQHLHLLYSGLFLSFLFL